MKSKLLKKETREETLNKMLAIIRKRPGIRPRELNQLLHREHSASLRGTLFKRGLVRKERQGARVQYYPIKPKRQAEI